MFQQLLVTQGSTGNHWLPLFVSCFVVTDLTHTISTDLWMIKTGCDLLIILDFCVDHGRIFVFLLKLSSKHNCVVDYAVNKTMLDSQVTGIY